MAVKKRMNKFVLAPLVIWLLALFANAANPPGFAWAKSVSGDNWEHIWSIATDRNGDTYITGDSFSSLTTYGSLSLTGGPQTALFIAKCDRDGTPLWLKGRPRAQGVPVVVDHEDNVYLGGMFSSANFDLGGTNLVRSNPSGDAFFAKLTPDGTVQWIRQLSSTNLGFSSASAMAVQGNYLHVAFNCPGSVGFGTNWATNTGVALGTWTLDGDLVSFVRVGDGVPNSNGPDGISTISGGTNESFFVGGRRGAGTYVAKYFSDGTRSWDRAFTNAGSQNQIRSVKGLPDGSVALAAYASAPVVFGGTNLPKGGILARFDSSGNLLWAVSSTNAIWSSLVVDAQTNFLVGGQFITNQFQGQAGMRIAKFSLEGSLQWSTNAPFGTGDTFSFFAGLSLAPNGALNFCGFFGSSTIQFGETTLTNGGLIDGFVGRLATDPPMLKWEHLGGTLQLSWSRSHGDFALEEATALTNWTELAFTTNVALGICESTNQMQNPSAIFRLKARP